MCECGTTTTGKFLGKGASMLGDFAQNYAVKRFKSFIGQGDYKIHTNSLISGEIGGGPSELS